MIIEPISWTQQHSQSQYLHSHRYIKLYLAPKYLIDVKHRLQNTTLFPQMDTPINYYSKNPFNPVPANVTPEREWSSIFISKGCISGLRAFIRTNLLSNRNSDRYGCGNYIIVYPYFQSNGGILMILVVNYIFITIWINCLFSLLLMLF